MRAGGRGGIRAWHMHDVIVVGGGPTGFVTALGLAQAGVDVCLIEAGDGDHLVPARLRLSLVDARRARAARHPRGGRADRLHQGRLPVAGQEDRRAAAPTTSRCSSSVTPFPYNIQLGQDRLAEICLAPARGACPTRRSTGGPPFTGLSQDADGVTVTRRRAGRRGRAARPLGDRRRRRGQRGAQGARPVVRRHDLARALRRHQPAARFRKRAATGSRPWWSTTNGAR